MVSLLLSWSFMPVFLDPAAPDAEVLEDLEAPADEGVLAAREAPEVREVPAAREVPEVREVPVAREVPEVRDPAPDRAAEGVDRREWLSWRPEVSCFPFFFLAMTSPLALRAPTSCSRGTAGYVFPELFAHPANPV
jgi:hypothetical protein